MERATYSTEVRTVDGFQVHVLRQDQKAVAEIAPELGNNCFAFRVAAAGVGSDAGQWLHLIDAPPDLTTLQRQPDIYGIPILFPFPNRIRGGTWHFEGETCHFDKPADSPTSIHGLLLNRPYRLVSHTANDEGAALVCRLESGEFQDIGRQFPFPFSFTMTYTLKDAALSMNVSIHNTGSRNMPLGFGIHPYFRVALSRNANAAAALIKVPAAEYWELDADSLPTGKTLAAGGDLDLRSGRPFAGLELDHVFTDVQMDSDGVSRCSIENRDAGTGMVIESDTQFRELVVYTPPGRDTICFEPYTCPTDAINLEAKGIPAGVIGLAPDQTFAATVGIKPAFPEPL